MSKDSSRLQDLFAKALDRSPEERGSFLDQACGGDAALRAQLMALLEADAQVAETTARPIITDLAGILDPESRVPSLQGSRVGPYELRESLGQGGMGQVWRAERIDGTVAQTVAIKFVHRALLDAETQRRFELERRLLASFDHPNIARLIDAAELPDGTPYYVMEFIDGVPITRYCDDLGLGVRARVELLKAVCGAVSEAHHKLVVHRDIKPNNVLVTRDGVPKLLDFGIAKRISDDVTERTVTAQRYFSPKYAAPEQLANEPIGVATDIYTLGLLGYELLARRPPFDYAELTAGQVERLIRLVPPEAPSRKLAETGSSAALRRLARQLRGDLDDILLRCLRKSPIERYASVEKLEADLENFLTGRPVSARGGHGWYRLGKFLRRNLVATVAGGLAAVGLVGGAAVALWAARQERLRAEQLEQLVAFQAAMFEQIDPSRAGTLLNDGIIAGFEHALASRGVGEQDRASRVASLRADLRDSSPASVATDLLAESVLRPAIDDVDRKFKRQPAVAAIELTTLAAQLARLGKALQAADVQRRVVALCSSAAACAPVQKIKAEESLGSYLTEAGKFDEAETILRALVAESTATLGPDDVVTLGATTTLANLLQEVDGFDEAIRLYREALARQQVILGDADPQTISTMHNLSFALRTVDHQHEAERLARRAVQLADPHPDLSESSKLLYRSNLGLILIELNNLDEAEPLMRDVLERRRKLLGDDHEATEISMVNVADILQARHRLAEALALLDEATSRARRVLGDDHPRTRRFQRRLGLLHLELGHYDEAEVALRECLPWVVKTYGDDGTATLVARMALAEIASRRGHPEAALVALAADEAAARSRFTSASAHLLAVFLRRRGDAQVALGDFGAAERTYAEAEQVLDKIPSVNPFERRDLLNAQLAMYHDWDESRHRAAHAAESEKIRKALDGLPSPP